MIREGEYAHLCLHAEALRLEDEGLTPQTWKINVTLRGVGFRIKGVLERLEPLLELPGEMIACITDRKLLAAARCESKALALEARLLAR